MCSNILILKIWVRIKIIRCTKIQMASRCDIVVMMTLLDRSCLVFFFWYNEVAYFTTPYWLVHVRYCTDGIDVFLTLYLSFIFIHTFGTWAPLSFPSFISLLSFLNIVDQKKNPKYCNNN